MSHHLRQMTIQGFLGKDAELHYTAQSGRPVCDFSLASTVTIGQGESKRDDTLWIKCVLWNKQAEGLVAHLKKGTQLIVTGSNFKTEVWLDKEGNPRAQIVLTVEKVHFCGGGAAGGQQTYSDADYPYAGSGSNAGGNDTSDNDDIPF